MLIFLSRGYFVSKNCLREVRAAVDGAKPLILVREPQSNKGGASVAEMRNEAPADLVDAVFGGREAIDLHRMESFRLHGFEMIASQLLWHLPASKGSLSPPSLTYYGRLTDREWYFDSEQVLLVSSNNPGAREAAARLQAFARKGSLLVLSLQEATLEPGQDEESSVVEGVSGAAQKVFSLASARRAANHIFGAADDLSVPRVVRGNSRMRGRSRRSVALDTPSTRHSLASTSIWSAGPIRLRKKCAGGFLVVYLNAHTFQGAAGDRFADEVLRACQYCQAHPELRILLLHERDPAAGGVDDFEHFFVVTPRELLQGQSLYNELAVPLMAPPYDDDSLAEVCVKMRMRSSKKARSFRGQGAANSSDKIAPGGCSSPIVEGAAVGEHQINGCRGAAGPTQASGEPMDVARQWVRKAERAAADDVGPPAERPQPTERPEPRIGATDRDLPRATRATRRASALCADTAV